MHMGRTYIINVVHIMKYVVYVVNIMKYRCSERVNENIILK